MFPHPYFSLQLNHQIKWTICWNYSSDHRTRLTRIVAWHHLVQIPSAVYATKIELDEACKKRKTLAPGARISHGSNEMFMFWYHWQCTHMLSRCVVYLGGPIATPFPGSLPSFLLQTSCEMVINYVAHVWRHIGSNLIRMTSKVMTTRWWGTSLHWITWPLNGALRLIYRQLYKGRLDVLFLKFCCIYWKKMLFLLFFYQKMWRVMYSSWTKYLRSSLGVINFLGVFSVW